MIKTREDLDRYIEEDCLANLNALKLPFWKEIIYHLYQKDEWMAFDYLRSLRKYEYAINSSHKNFCEKIRVAYYKYVNHIKGVRYNISIGANMVGPGLRIAHVVGGGYNN